jgi:uncharacterized membrane protein YfcA
MILVPFITMIFTAQGSAPHAIIHMAVATSLGVIMFTSISSVRAHHQHGAVLWSVALAGAGHCSGRGAAWIAKQLSSAGQALLFAVFLTISATQILFGKKAATPAAQDGAAAAHLPAAAPCSAPAC